MSDEVSSHSAMPSVNRPQVQFKQRDNSRVAMAPSVQRRLGIITNEPKTLAPELYAYIARPELMDFSVAVEEVLQEAADRGLSAPHEFLTWFDMEISTQLIKYKSLDAARQALAMDECGRRIAAMYLAHSTVLMCWVARLETPNGESWRAAL